MGQTLIPKTLDRYHALKKKSGKGGSETWIVHLQSFTPSSTQTYSYYFDFISYATPINIIIYNIYTLIKSIPNIKACSRLPLLTTGQQPRVSLQGHRLSLPCSHSPSKNGRSDDKEMTGSLLARVSPEYIWWCNDACYIIPQDEETQDEPVGCHGDTVKKHIEFNYQLHSTKRWGSLRERWPRMKVSQPVISNTKQSSEWQTGGGLQNVRIGMFRIQGCSSISSLLPYIQMIHIHTVWKKEQYIPRRSSRDWHLCASKLPV